MLEQCVNIVQRPLAPLGWLLGIQLAVGKLTRRAEARRANGSRPPAALATWPARHKHKQANTNAFKQYNAWENTANKLAQQFHFLVVLTG